MNDPNLILILGDQLSLGLASLKAGDSKRDVVVMGELHDEASYVKHHKKKIAFVFSAMRHFAAELRRQGWKVDYTEYQSQNVIKSFQELVSSKSRKYAAAKLIVVEPGEWRIRQQMEKWGELLGLPIEILDDDRFICRYEEFNEWASDRKQFRMEYFYREMRRKTGLLMEGDEPIGGKWNFDADNRKPAKRDLFIPMPAAYDPDEITQAVIKLVEDCFGDHFGDLDRFWFGVTATDAEAAFDHFIDHALPFFGDYQDAMLEGERFLYHSVISLYLNIGLLDPLGVCKKIEKAYHSGDAPLNAVEGFIRQVIGWREYIRGIYWRLMPDYVEENFFNADRALPELYWTGNTKMACMRAAITQTKEEAYAHHIQRLMVTGNFALIAGIAPKEIHEWYLLVYADAYEWVELPNTLGMSQFADGGLLGSKPYAASGNYINKMSDYCSRCHYDVKQKNGDGACPFNSLYWDFLIRNEDKLRDNPRMKRIYSTWARMGEGKRAQTLKTAKAFLAALDNGEEF